MRELLVIALGLLAWPALAQAHKAKTEQHEERLPTIGAAPDFALTSQDGARGDARGAARQGRRGDVHLRVLPRRLPDADRQAGAGAGRAGSISAARSRSSRSPPIRSATRPKC